MKTSSVPTAATSMAASSFSTPIQAGWAVARAESLHPSGDGLSGGEITRQRLRQPCQQRVNEQQAYG